MAQWVWGCLLLSCGAVFAGNLTATFSSPKAGQGEVTVLRVEWKGQVPPPELSASFGETKIKMTDCPGTALQSRCGLVPVSVEMAPGKHDVVVSTGGPTPETLTLPLTVRQVHFTRTKMRVDPDLTELSPEDKARTEREKQEINAVIESSDPKPLWEGGFRLPAKGGITSKFGNQRTFNGSVKSVHYGADLRASKGTPIYASNAGRVVLAKEFFFAGNMVVVDHGAGIFSSYAHLSRIDVQVGQNVKKGDRVGAAGATGRVTGPHLHWAVRVNGLSVDPHQMMRTFNRFWEASPKGKKPTAQARKRRSKKLSE